MAEQRYKAVMAVITEGRTITQVARDWDVSRQTMHAWLARYEAEGLEGLANLSHRPAHCPHQMATAVEVQLLEMRRARPYWGARRLAFELRRKGVQPAPSKSAIYRSLVRAGVIDPLQRQRRSEKWKRWERGARWTCGSWMLWMSSSRPTMLGGGGGAGVNAEGMGIEALTGTTLTKKLAKSSDPARKSGYDPTS